MYCSNYLIVSLLCLWQLSLSDAGKIVPQGKYPFFASFQSWVAWSDHTGSKSRLQFCGSTILTDRWVLTSASCIMRRNIPKATSMHPPAYNVVVGMTKMFYTFEDHIVRTCSGIENPVDRWTKLQVVMDKLVVHPQWNPDDENQLNDVALAHMNRPIKLGMNTVPLITPVELINAGNNSFPFQHQTCFVPGFGCDPDGFPAKDNLYLELLEDQLYVLDATDACKANRTKRFCAQSPSYRAHLCLGDTGSPLLCNNGNNWIQVGILSHPDPSSNRRRFFTTLATYIQWIDSVVGKDLLPYSPH